METGLADLLGLIFGFLLTLMVLSYIIGDNFLFRLAMAIFVGVASGYAAVLVIYNVLWYQLIVPLLTNPMANLALTVPSALLGIWLLTKGSSRLSRFGNPVLAFLVGVGAATAFGDGQARRAALPPLLRRPRRQAGAVHHGRRPHRRSSDGSRSTTARG